MRQSGYSLAFLLAVLLTCTTPVGTGAGMHQFDLLHPLFSHVHIVNGRVVAHDQLAETKPERAPGGPAIGAAAGSGLADTGLGVSPANLLPFNVLVCASSPRCLDPDVQMAIGREEAPPDPPPVA